MTPPEHPRVLFVDDEPNLLAAIVRQTRQRFNVATASSAAEGFRRIACEGPFAVVVSDLRMPEMDGVAFLGKVRQEAPETVRVLLTGQADVEAAIAAVNEGALFRFLQKPCPPETLLRTLTDAAEQHRLITAEQVLLKQTLEGSIKILLDVLVLAQPQAFGRAVRIKQEAVALAGRLENGESWALPIAAMLSQIGCITLPPETIEKLHAGAALSAREQDMVNRIPEVNARLVGSIPRLEPVREILLHAGKDWSGSGLPDGPGGEAVPWGARILRLVADHDLLLSRGLEDRKALEVLRAREGVYDPVMLDELARMRDAEVPVEERVLSLSELNEGMVFAEDLRTRSGLLLIARGHEVTPSLLEKIRNLPAEIGVREPVRVKLAAAGILEPAVART